MEGWKEGDYLLNEWTELTGEASSDWRVLGQTDEGGGRKGKEGERGKILRKREIKDGILEEDCAYRR